MPTPIGKNKTIFTNFETKYIKVIEYSHYVKKQRDHMWVLECKVCNKHFTTRASSIKKVKSCGCFRSGVNRYHPLDSPLNYKTYSRKQILAMPWVI